MSLEVRQLVLKATVAEDGSPATEGSVAATGPGLTAALDPEQLKQEILAACRQWLQEALRQQRER